MENTELRIGNWVQYENEYAQVSAIWANGNFEIHSEVLQFWTIEKGDEYVKGIPLTPEILVKCGLILESTSSFSKKYTHKRSEFGYDWDMSAGWRARYYGRYIECKYVHQLQNLYFAVTGEELNIEL